MTWDDYRFNGYRRSLEEHRDMWLPVHDIAVQQGAELAINDARARIQAFETALRLLDVWVKGVQEEEARDRMDG